MPGVTGHPIGHNLNPRMHNAAFATDGKHVRDGQRWVYVPMDVRPELLSEAVRRLADLGSAGFGVTVQHKQAMLAFVDELDEAVNLAGAVNTFVVGEGRIWNINTDGSGFVEACEEAEAILAGQWMPILGAGAAITVAVLNEDIWRLYVAAQTANKAEELRAQLSEVGSEAEILTCSLEEAGDVAAEAGIIVNATYLGMKKEDPLPLPAGTLTTDKVVCDAICVAEWESALIREAGARTAPGSRMLLYQGVRRVWIGGEPNVEVMSDARA